MYSWVKKYVGIPFVSGGRDMTGCDCYGLVRLVLNTEYGCNLPILNGDYTNALNSQETKLLFAEYVPVLCAEKNMSPDEMSVCLMRMNGMTTHIGIYAGSGFILHARNKTGAVCERISSPFLTGRIEGWYHVSKDYRTVEPVLKRKERI